MPRSKAVLLLLSLATLSAPLIAQTADPAVPGNINPGTINYVEGQATLAGKTVSQRSVGYARLDAGQVFQTGAGKAEILLTPGVFLRLGANSAATMISPNLNYTEVELLRGRADVEVDQLYKENDIVIRDQGVQTQLVENGLYEFNANDGSVHVFEGKAAVFTGDTTDQKAANHHAIEVKGGHELSLTRLGKPQGFNRDASEDDLYHWSSLRSQYLGEANAQLAPAYAGGGFAPGWAWDPGLYEYTWLPGDGLFYSPFGFGFYSPFYYGGYGFYGGFGYGGGYRGGYGGGYRGFGGGGGFRGGGRR